MVQRLQGNALYERSERRGDASNEGHSRPKPRAPFHCSEAACVPCGSGTAVGRPKVPPAAVSSQPQLTGTLSCGRGLGFMVVGLLADSERC